MIRALLLILGAYVAFSIYLFRGYEGINDSLQTANTKLMNGCINGKIDPNENEPYK